jgi:hypothetical protein
MSSFRQVINSRILALLACVVLLSSSACSAQPAKEPAATLPATSNILVQETPDAGQETGDANSPTSYTENTNTPASPNGLLKEQIIGTWVSNLGPVIGLGNETQYLEFFADGTATNRTTITNFVGKYTFISNDTIRVEWKEQGAFGTSPIEILKIRFQSPDTIYVTDDASGITYEYTSAVAAQKTAEAIPSVAPIVIKGTWQHASSTDDQYSEFTFDGKGNVIAVSNINTNPDSIGKGIYAFQQDREYGWVLSIDISDGKYPFWSGGSYQIVKVTQDRLILRDSQFTYEFHRVADTNRRTPSEAMYPHHSPWVRPRGTSTQRCWA